MSIFDQFATDQQAEEEGKWFGLTLNAEIKLAALTSKRAETARRAIERKYSAFMRLKGGPPADVLREMALHTITHGCVVDWRGSDWVDDSGKPIACTAENAQMIFERLPKLRDMVSSILTDDESYKAERREEAEGNSAKS